MNKYGEEFMKDMLLNDPSIAQEFKELSELFPVPGKTIYGVFIDPEQAAYEGMRGVYFSTKERAENWLRHGDPEIQKYYTIEELLLF